MGQLSVARCRRRDAYAIAITDHNSLAGIAVAHARA